MLATVVEQAVVAKWGIAVRGSRLAFLVDFLKDWAAAGVYLDEVKIIEVKNYEETSFAPSGNIPLNAPSGAGPRIQPDHGSSGQGNQLAAAI
jgi:hypothetical protein